MHDDAFEEKLSSVILSINELMICLDKWFTVQSSPCQNVT